MARQFDCRHFKLIAVTVFLHPARSLWTLPLKSGDGAHFFGGGTATTDFGCYAAGFRCFRISWCNSLKSFGGMASDLLTNFTAEAGQGTAHTPQPIHHSLSTTGKSPSILMT